MKLFQPFVVLLLLIVVQTDRDQTLFSVSQNEKQSDSTAIAITFRQTILPLLKTNCSPCHFEGGVVYGRYPFDDYATAKTLGEKLNTRLKEEKQKSLIMDWLNAGALDK